MSGVPPSLYWPNDTDSLISKMRADVMPQPFIRRMRLINLISAVLLYKIEPKFLSPFDLIDLSHILDKQVGQDAIIDALDHEEVAEALRTGNLAPLYTLALK